MAMDDFNKSKFNFSEIFNNQDGKTSASSFCGVIVTITGCILALSATSGYYFDLKNTIDLLEISAWIIAIGAGLLGVRKVFGTKGNTLLDSTNNSNGQKTP